MNFFLSSIFLQDFRRTEFSFPALTGSVSASTEVSGHRSRGPSRLCPTGKSAGGTSDPSSTPDPVDTNLNKFQDKCDQRIMTYVTHPHPRLYTVHFPQGRTSHRIGGNVSDVTGLTPWFTFPSRVAKVDTTDVSRRGGATPRRKGNVGERDPSTGPRRGVGDRGREQRSGSEERLPGTEGHPNFRTDRTRDDWNLTRGRNLVPRLYPLPESVPTPVLPPTTLTCEVGRDGCQDGGHGTCACQ